jgi:hypothetical protein
MRRFTDHDVAVTRFLLQARSHVDRIADHVVVGAADDHLARVDRDSETDFAEGRRLLARARGSSCMATRRARRASRRPRRRGAKGGQTPSPSSFTTVPPWASTAACSAP